MRDPHANKGPTMADLARDATYTLERTVKVLTDRVDNLERQVLILTQHLKSAPKGLRS